MSQQTFYCCQNKYLKNYEKCNIISQKKITNSPKKIALKCTYHLVKIVFSVSIF